MMDTWSLSEHLLMFTKSPFWSSIGAIGELLYIIVVKFGCCPHWIRNTVVHAWLIRNTILGVSKSKEKVSA